MISEHRRPFLAFVLVAVFCAVVMGESFLADRTPPRAQRVDITRIDPAHTSPTAASAPAAAGAVGTPAQPARPASSSAAASPTGPEQPATGPGSGGGLGPDPAGGQAGPPATVSVRKHRKGGRTPADDSGDGEPTKDGSAGDSGPLVAAGNEGADSGDGTQSDEEPPAAEDSEPRSPGRSGSRRADDAQPEAPPPAD